MISHYRFDSPHSPHSPHYYKSVSYYLDCMWTYLDYLDCVDCVDTKTGFCERLFSFFFIKNSNQWHFQLK
jgi:hypothetical protein